MFTYKLVKYCTIPQNRMKTRFKCMIKQNNFADYLGIESLAYFYSLSIPN